MQSLFGSIFSGMQTYLDSSYQAGPHIPHLFLIAAELERKLQQTLANYYWQAEQANLVIRWPLIAILALCSSPYFLFQLPAFFNRASSFQLATFSPSFFKLSPLAFSTFSPSFFHFLPQLFSLSPPAFCLVRASGEPRR